MIEPSPAPAVRPRPPRRAAVAAALRVLIATLLAALLATGAAQIARGADPERVADEAVEAWRGRGAPDLGGLAALSPEEACRELGTLLVSPPPPDGTRVNVDDRVLFEEAEGRRVYTYSAALPDDRPQVVQVVLEREGEAWVATEAGFRPRPARGRGWLQTPAAGWGFALVTLAVLALLVRPSFLRRWLAEGARVVREHRAIVIATQLGLYGVFALGASVGAGLPAGCADAIVPVVERAVTALGATEAYGSGNVARAAALTFYQNFVVVTLTATFGAALLFGVPAYLLSSLSFFAQAIPFGLVGAFSGPQAVFVLVLLGLELSAYFLVVAGGGILLATVIRGGLRAFPLGVRRAALMLPFAMLLLLVGAWYEAAALVLFG